MLASFVLALREGVEAALVIGILIGALRKMQRSELSASVWWGVVSAFGVSALVAVGITAAGTSLKDPAEAIFEGITMFAAAGLLTWMILWMRNQSRSLKITIEAQVSQALGKAGKGALFGVAFAAVVREGIELAIYLVAAGLESNPRQELLGASLGLIAAAGLGWLLFSSTRRLPLNRFFQVTNILLILFAAGLVTQGVHEFIDAGWIPAIMPHIYNLSPILNENSPIGQLFKAILGYNDSPSLIETLSYLVYFAILAITVFRAFLQPAISADQRKLT